MRKIYHRQPVHKVRVQGLDVSRDVISISIRKSVSGAPGSASITLKNDRGQYNGVFSNKLNRNYVKIWLGNFKENDIMPCEFYGFVSEIREEVAIGQHQTISLFCESFIRVFGLTKVVLTRPSVIEDSETSTPSNLPAFITGVFSKMNTIDIVKFAIEESYSPLQRIGDGVYRMSRDGTIVDFARAQRGRVPYPTNFQDPIFFNQEYMTPAQIINTIASRVDHEFFDDGFRVYFRQPDYLLSGADVLSGKGLGYSTIKDEDLISYAFSDSDKGIYTIAIVSGTFHVDYLSLPEPVASSLVGEYHDKALLDSYGERILSLSNPSLYSDFHAHHMVENPDAKYALGLFGAGVDIVRQPRLYLEYGRYTLQRLYQDRLQGELTLVGRSGIKLGSTIILPWKKMMYHVYSVNHSYTYGRSWVTKVGLKSGRPTNSPGITPVNFVDFSNPGSVTGGGEITELPK